MSSEMTTDEDTTVDTVESPSGNADRTSGPPRPVPVEYDLVDIETVTYDDDSGAYWTRYDWQVDPPGLAAISVLAAISDRDPTGLTPLQEAVDLDALNSLLASGRDGGNDPTVTFTVEHYRVTVGTTHVRVRPIGTAGPSTFP